MNSSPGVEYFQQVYLRFKKLHVCSGSAVKWFESDPKQQEAAAVSVRHGRLQRDLHQVDSQLFVY